MNRTIFTNAKKQIKCLKNSYRDHPGGSIQSLRLLKWQKKFSLYSMLANEYTSLIVPE